MTSLGFLLVLCAGAADAQVNLVSQVIGFVAGFADQGERRRRRSEGLQSVFSVVRRESGGQRPPTGNSLRRHCFHKGHHRERCRRGGTH